MAIEEEVVHVDPISFREGDGKGSVTLDTDLLRDSEAGNFLWPILVGLADSVQKDM